MKSTLALIITSLAGLTSAHPAVHQRCTHHNGASNTGLIRLNGTSTSTNVTSGNTTSHHPHHQHNNTTATTITLDHVVDDDDDDAVTLDTLDARGSTSTSTPPRTSVSAAGAAVLFGRSQTGTGRMTYYTPGQGSCGATNTASDMVVAVSAATFGTYANPNASPACQMTATITCGKTTVRAAVRDKCPGCGAEDIDVSPAVFKLCGDLSLGVIQVSWAVAK